MNELFEIQESAFNFKKENIKNFYGTSQWDIWIQKYGTWCPTLENNQILQGWQMSIQTMHKLFFKWDSFELTLNILKLTLGLVVLPFQCYLFCLIIVIIIMSHLILVWPCSISSLTYVSGHWLNRSWFWCWLFYTLHFTHLKNEEIWFNSIQGHTPVK